MSEALTTLEQFERFVAEHSAAAVYFASPECSVCHALEPRVAALLEAHFPRMALARVDCRQSPELASQQRVFTVPTVAVYFDGRETVRLSRSFALGELQERLERPYAMLFG